MLRNSMKISNLLLGMLWTPLIRWMTKYNYWESLFNSVAEKHMPTKRMRFRKMDVPYMTP